MKNIFMLSALMLSVLAVSACENTWKGAGRDMEQTGETIQGSVDGNNYQQ